MSESLFRHKPKVWYSCMASSLSDFQHSYHDILQNHRGHPSPPPKKKKKKKQVWVLAYVTHAILSHLGGDEGIVHDRSATTLLPIIQQHDMFAVGQLFTAMNGQHTTASNN